MTQVYQKVYIVYGVTGEYYDKSEWDVRAFLDRIQAVTFQNRLNKWCMEHKVWDSGPDVQYGDRILAVEQGHPEDPCFITDYTGTGYYISEVPLDTSEAQLAT